MLPEDYETVTARLAGRDEFYQTMLRQAQANEAAYERIRNRLSKEEREALSLYIAACEAMEYRKSQLAAAYYAVIGANKFKSEDNF